MRDRHEENCNWLAEFFCEIGEDNWHFFWENVKWKAGREVAHLGARKANPPKKDRRIAA